jgi:DNA invertase Pin-like site-specific DNA recombinase
MKYGYARVSDESLTLETQIAELKAAGCEVIRHEKKSGTTREGRTELQLILDLIRKDDVLIVSKLDRLARNTVDMLTIISELGKKGVKFKSLAEPWADTDSPAGELIITVMAGVAQFEAKRIAERRDAGIKRARENGEKRENGMLKYAGRVPSLPRTEILAARGAGEGPASIAKRLGIARSSIYRVLAEPVA